ncbi:hypothetical protein NMK34_13015 [Micromonospora sp. BRA006-A]|uniref:hypothetical protein n=1 Tax=Micromonospora sp. BRA006-A TaxID=2962860 RepID=UPI00296E2E92|nr:hypothetical protein [Micromonospora sp. BRA006-A]MDW3847518.1 hypothetical protein [Micromonospora sp. BRA006-A]
MHADADEGWAAAAPYDAIIVTVETSDIPPAWTDRLAPRRRPRHAAADARPHPLPHPRPRRRTPRRHQCLVCGFVPMQGAGANPVTPHHLRGDDVTAPTLTVCSPSTGSAQPTRHRRSSPPPARVRLRT